jgi:hypothetical protein
MQRRVWMWAIALLGLLGTGAAVSAHQPWFNPGSPDPGEPYALRTPLEISQVVYGGFTGPGQVDFYSFAAPADFRIDINLVTDDDDACDDFRPAFTVIGQGFPASERATPVPIPEDIPAPDPGEGAVTIAGGTWEPFYERFAGVTFVRGPAFTGTLAGGEYLIAVFDPDGGEGVYGLALGGEEVIGGEADFFTKFEPWTRCQPVRGADPWDPFAVG